MATSYINTGVLGQVVGGSLGTQGLEGNTAGAQFQSYSSQVQRKKRRLSGLTAEERNAVAQRRTDRLAQSQVDLVTASNPAPLPVDTADIKVPTASTYAVDTKTQQPVQVTPPVRDTGIVTAPKAVTAPPPAPVASPVLNPTRQYSEADAAYARALVGLQGTVGSKIGTGRVKGASSSITDAYSNLAQLAAATGNQQYVKDVAAIQGIGYRQKAISAQNIGSAYAGLGKAVMSARNNIDLEYLMAQPVGGSLVKNALSKTLLRR